MGEDILVDLPKLVSCLKAAYAEPAVIEGYIGGGLHSQEDVKKAIAIRRILGQWVRDGYLDRSYLPTLNGRSETSYKHGRRWGNLLAEIQGIEKKRTKAG
jgi:hypothetical protein